MVDNSSRVMRQRLIFFLLIGFCVSNGKAGMVIVDISSYNPTNENSNVFTQFVDNFDRNVVEVIVTNNASTSGFYILQAHSFQYNISLSKVQNGNEETKQNITGRNVGLVEQFVDKFSSLFVIQNWTDRNCTIMIAVTVYDSLAPVPGGCPDHKISSPQNIYPLVEVVNSPDIIAIMSEAASVKGLPCNGSNEVISVEIYHVYLMSQNFDPFEYYGGIKKMLTVSDIKSNGRLVSRFQGNETFDYYTLFSSYIGVGEVFNILVTSNGKTSAYVPSISYGKDINDLIRMEKNGSDGKSFFIILFSILPFVALVIIYAGHLLFHFTTFTLGLSCGTIVSFFILSKQGGSTVDETFLVSLVIGILYGFIWVGIWYKCGIPLLSASLAFLHVGALIAAMIYHTGIADNENFRKDVHYWCLFGVIVFMCWFTLSVFTMQGHIFACSFLGSYILMITTLNYWMGGNLQYVIINVYRRMFVPSFNKAVLDPPFQPRDKLIILVGIIFVLHGFRKQLNNQKGRPPFPPHSSHGFGGERTPLLGVF